MRQIEFKDESETFVIRDPENYSGLYLPMAGTEGIKSSITPNWGGDSKTDQNHFLLEPVSAENLHNNKNTRNFWCRIEGEGYWSVCGNSAEQESSRFTREQDESIFEAGFMWQTLVRKSKKYGIEAKMTTFVPVDGAAEVTFVTLTNNGDEKMEVTPIAAIPIYGRSADNIRDHRHVTSLLHRIYTSTHGITVTPVLSFDERGHQKNETSYFVYGWTENGEAPESFYPTVEEFIGEGGSFLIPEAVRKEKAGKPAGVKIQGKEAVGGIRFAKAVLEKGESRSYIVLAGIAQTKEQIEKTASRYRTLAKGMQALDEVKTYWRKQVNVSFETGNKREDHYLKWICFQPILRRIYGCSFLPYHDYGKGGRGWRDLWQDCLALLIMEPSLVRQMILSNYGGVRMDGTNATIIGNRPGEFVADRNNITRVWMDHAFWPFVTTKFYMDQTGDLEVLLEKVPYFKDLQAKRGEAHDTQWRAEEGDKQRTKSGQIYFGSVLEHILLQNLCAFFDVGEHNEMRLHGADWNDALDMAWERGESVAFTCAYAGNLKDIAKYLRNLEQKCGYNKVELAEEMQILLTGGNTLFEDPGKKQNLLKQYGDQCIHNISGKTILVKIEEISRNLEEKAQWLMEHIRTDEWIKGEEGEGWFNGYYDNHGNAVERYQKDQIRMMLTGQVFAIMSGTADAKQIKEICRSADHYLYEKSAGGYRLNTDFKEEKFDLGRMFGFAYGEKENGAVFSHMTVMYANALYQRGFAKEGYKALNTLLEAAQNFENSKMYPGIPEYFDNQGRGLYAYLTGAASWYMLTVITEMFGVKGELGDLTIHPSLMPEQFDDKGNASVYLEFGKRKFKIQIKNPDKAEPGAYRIKKAACDDNRLALLDETKASLVKKQINALKQDEIHQIVVLLEKC